jgi:hypothetical protein
MGFREAHQGEYALVGFVILGGAMGRKVAIQPKIDRWLYNQFKRFALAQGTTIELAIEIALASALERAGIKPYETEDQNSGAKMET